MIQCAISTTPNRWTRTQGIWGETFSTPRKLCTINVSPLLNSEEHTFVYFTKFYSQPRQVMSHGQQSKYTRPKPNPAVSHNILLIGPDKKTGEIEKRAK
jgi:hypothetical protein